MCCTVQLKERLERQRAVVIAWISLSQFQSQSR